MPEPKGEEPVVPETPEPTLPDSSQISNLSYLWEITCAVGDSLTTGAVNIATGAYNTVKELVFTVVDIVMVSTDTVGTIVGSPIGWNEWSSQGQSFQDATTLGIVLNAGRAGLGGGTLGMSEIVISTYNYIQDGDADAFQQHLGGVSMGNLMGATGLRHTGIFTKSNKFSVSSLRTSSSKMSLIEQMTPEEAARYQRYWKAHAPEQSRPYDMIRRYTEDGEIKQVTTYDEFGNRLVQFDLIDFRSNIPHRHDFTYLPNSRPYGIRDKLHTPLE